MAILESRTQTGISWFKESMDLFKKQPQKWLLLALAYISIFMMLPSASGLSVIAIFTVIIWPVFTAFAIMLYRSADLNKTETVQNVAQQLKPNVNKLMLLGALSLLYVTLASYLLSNDMHGMMQIVAEKTKLSESEYKQFVEKFIPFFFKLMLILIPLFICTWFSPMLIAINQYPLVKAVKSSIAGVLQYTVSLTMAWLLLTAFVMAGIMVIGLIIGILGLANALMPFMFFAVLLITTALVFAFQYVSYRDIFRAAPIGG